MQIGERIGPYEIRDTLGQGGMAEVFKAWHTGLHRFEALKIPTLRAHAASQGERAFINRFLTEARTAAGLRHPHIATIYGVSEADAADPYFAMELVEGSDLADLIHKRSRLSLNETLSILEPIAQALDYAHGRGIIHRDIKPGNVLLEAKADGWNPKVVDFGIARAAQVEGEASQTRLTQAGAIVGTPEYMSPEQAGNGDEVDYRSDIYALGIVTYEMLCGRPPFSAGQGTSPISVLVQHVRDTPPLPSALHSDLPASLNDALLWALAKHPDERPPSCMALVEALRPPDQSAVDVSKTDTTIQATAATASPNGASAEAVQAPRKGFPLVVPVLFVTGLALIGAAGLRRNPESLPAPTPAVPVPAATPQNVVPAVDPKITESSSLAEKAMPLVDEASAGMQDLEIKLAEGSIAREDAIATLQAQTSKLTTARDLTSRAVQLNRKNEDAWVLYCRASYYLDECKTSERLREATTLFPQSSRFKPLQALARKSMKDGCK